MIILVAEAQKDQEMLSKSQRAYENLSGIVDRLEDKNGSMGELERTRKQKDILMHFKRYRGGKSSEVRS